MTALLLTGLGHALAPLVDRVLQAAPRVEAAADPFVRLLVAAIVLGSVLPEGFGVVGWAAPLALAGGIVLGLAVHTLPGGHRSTDLLAAGGWLVHNAIDGVLLAASPDGGALAAAVILHTVPVAVAGWRLARHEAGELAAGTLLVAAAGATFVGWAAAGAVLHGVGEAPLALIQCGAAGVLLHLLGHVSGLSQPHVPVAHPS